MPYLPIAQAVPKQVSESAETWYWPAGHALQASEAEMPPVLVPTWPVGHFMQVLATVALAVEEYLPAEQSVQVLAAVAPAAAVEYLPAEQSVQVLASVAPAAEEYLPAEQSVQVLAALAPAAAQ